MSAVSSDNNVLVIKTVQIAPFRTLMTALKDILLETNITFQKDGIRIINMDKSHTILAHLHLNAENFEKYECKKDKIIVGVNMFHLFKLINSIDNDDTLTIYIEDCDYSDGVVSHLGLKFENGDIKQCKTQKLKLIEVCIDVKLKQCPVALPLFRLICKTRGAVEGPLLPLRYNYFWISRLLVASLLA